MSEQRSVGAKVVIPLLVCVALAISGVAACGGDGGGEVAPVTQSPFDGDGASPFGDDSEVPKTAPRASEEETHAIGETSRTGELDITVHRVEDPWTGDKETGTPPPGQRYIAVEMTIVNTGIITAFSPGVDSDLVDADGRVWDGVVTTIEAGLDHIFDPGTTRRGWIYHAVGEDASDLQLRLRGNISAEATTFALE